MDVVVQPYLTSQKASGFWRTMCATLSDNLPQKPDAFHVLKSTEPWELSRELLMKGLSGELPQEFVLVRDNVILTDKATPKPYANQKSLWISRKGKESDAMVNTIRILSEGDKPIYDFETFFPVLVNTEKMLQVLMENAGEITLFRTLYFNSIGADPVKEESPFIPLWQHGMNPKGPVVALSDTCFGHPECIKWINEHAIPAV